VAQFTGHVRTWLLTLGVAYLALGLNFDLANAQNWNPSGIYTAPIVVPPPPMADPAFELGTRLWFSEGRTNFGINSNRINPQFGNPTSTLSYDNLNGVSAEFTVRAKNDTGLVFKGFVGGGGIISGSLDDQDYFKHQIRFSDTYSKVEGSNMVYGTIDLGYDFKFNEYFAVTPFVGFNMWQETVDAFGARCLKDEVQGAFCGPPGHVAVPFTTKIIHNETNWASLRLGAEVTRKLSDRLTFVGDFAILPGAYVWNEDSHRLRVDLGPIPNIEDRGTGWGTQIEAELRYDLTPNWSAGAGVRYWYATTDGVSDFVNFGVKSKLEDFTSERFGVITNVTYCFATY
jgi:Protochlamydia outer membrane protein